MGDVGMSADEVARELDLEPKKDASTMTDRQYTELLEAVILSAIEDEVDLSSNDADIDVPGDGMFEGMKVTLKVENIQELIQKQQLQRRKAEDGSLMASKPRAV